MANKKFKFDITKYDFVDLAELLNLIEKIWVKVLKLENQLSEFDDCDEWDLDKLYFQGIDFSKSNNEGICVKFLAHDWNSPYEMSKTIPIDAIVDWDSYKERIIEEDRLEKERIAEEERKKEEKRLIREAKKKEKAEREELARLKEKYEK